MLVVKSWRASEMPIPLAVVMMLTLGGAAGLAFRRPSESLPSVGSIWVTVLVIQVPVILMVHRFLRRHGVGWVDGFGFRQGSRAALMGWVLGGIAGSVVVLQGVNLAMVELLRRLGVPADLQASVRALQTGPAAVKVSVALTATILAPLMEESLFRGILYQWVRDTGHRRVAMILTSVVFGVVHGNLPSLVPLAFFGGYLCWLYERTGNLLACILTHAGFNAVFVGFLLAGCSGS